MLIITSLIIRDTPEQNHYIVKRSRYKFEDIVLQTLDNEIELGYHGSEITGKVYDKATFSTTKIIEFVYDKDEDEIVLMMQTYTSETTIYYSKVLIGKRFFYALSAFFSGKEYIIKLFKEDMDIKQFDIEYYSSLINDFQNKLMRRANIYYIL